MELPVVCTLSPEALSARRQGLLTELVRLAESHEELDNGVRMAFAATDDALTRVVQTVAAERRCCEFLRFQITLEPAGGPLTLELTGPAGTREFLMALLDSPPATSGANTP